ncbi:MAG: hypothetical protein WCC84_07155 [Candidatus Cybelea sp.]
MVAHDILVDGVYINAPYGTVDTPKLTAPVILTMHDDDFPTRFLQDLATPNSPPISSAAPADIPTDPLFQPVQRMLEVAMVQLACNTPGYPRLDPRRVQSAGLVIRRCNRVRNAAGRYVDEENVLQGWMRSAGGLCQWRTLIGDENRQDPDPTKRPQYPSGQAELDRQLAMQSLASAYTESSTPAFIAPPDTCAILGRTVAYALVPTASSEVTDASPVLPKDYPAQIAGSLPTLLQAVKRSAPLPGQAIDKRWISDDYLNSQVTPALDAPSIKAFQSFLAAVRLVDGALGAFDGTTQGNTVLATLNAHNVTVSGSAMPMGEFYANAASVLLDDDRADPPPQPTITMPDAWDQLTSPDVQTFVDVLQSRAGQISTKIGRFHDRTRLYRLRMFFRVKSEHPNCPPELIWSQPSEVFRIAAWYESSDRPNAPVLLPDVNRNFLKTLKPNCSFAVPASLMSSMQGTSMSGLIAGSGGGGGGVGLGWICGFSIPLITICAFFVLNIFLSLLNIVFFWMAFIKICIPFPEPED